MPAFTVGSLIQYDREIFTRRVGAPGLSCLREKFMSAGAVPGIGFLGAGKMATALARGWLTAGLAVPERMCASDPMPQARQAFAAETGVRVAADNREVVADN